ncbi:MAG TPA: ADOP family duplicated permease [Acidobacteriaceae bacterium]
MFSLGQDLRFSLRQLRKSPGYAFVAILTLALGIGANTAIFLLTYSIVLQSLPVPHAGQLIRYTFRSGGGEVGLSYPQYKAMEQRQTAASGLFAWSSDDATLRGNGQPEKIRLALATGPIFPVLELRPALGRGLSPKAGEPGNAYQPEAVLSYAYWHSEFHGDRSVIGRTLDIDNNSVTVVGVLPASFEGVEPGQKFDALLPLSFSRLLHPDSPMMDMGGAFWLTVMGRLRPGETLAGAIANLNAIRAAVNEAADPSHHFLNGGFFSSYTLGVESGRAGESWLRFRYRKPLLALESLCGLMMLLCGVNVALVVISRVSGRLHEFAMRTALGAGRGRLFTQVLTETVLLGICGLACGGLLGWRLCMFLVGMISDSGMPPALEVRAGFVVIGFAAAISIGAAALAGLWPAWRAAGTAPAIDLRQIGSGRTAARLGRWIIPTQVALGVVLLNAALLLAGTLLTFLREHSGFNADQTVLADLNLSEARLPAKTEPPKVNDFLQQLRAMPGVHGAAILSMPPIHHGFSVAGFYTRDEKGNLLSNQQVWPETVSGDYFSVMGTRILAGRAFAAADAAGDRVCVISAAAAAFFFPGRPAVGASLHSGDGTEKPAESAPCRVIGVAEDARMKSLLASAPLVVYMLTGHQTPGVYGYATAAVRAANPQLAEDAIRRVYALEFPTLPPPVTWRFHDAVNADLSQQRLLSSVSGGFALLALALVATGLYGVLARAVVERRREIGIRMALGAQRGQIVSNLARGAAMRVLIGVAAGAGLALLAGRLLRTLLYGVTGASPAIGLATLVLLLAVLALAFVFPAGRAASIDPMEAIRDE